MVSHVRRNVDFLIQNSVRWLSTAESIAVSFDSIVGTTHNKDRERYPSSHCLGMVEMDNLVSKKRGWASLCQPNLLMIALQRGVSLALTTDQKKIYQKKIYQKTQMIAPARAPSRSRVQRKNSCQ